MDWIEISITTNTEGADIVSEALMRAGAKGTQIIDRADVPDPAKPSGYWELIDPALIEQMPEEVVVKAWFQEESQLAGLAENIAQLPQLAGFDLGALALSQNGVAEKDWAEYWKRFYKPFRIGSHLVVRPSWEEYTEQPGDVMIHLDPGLAFGTGTHETTALCAELIEWYYEGGTVLDVGTGSGILAIAAARLGAEQVTAIDIDPMAVRTAQENVEKNGLEGRIEVRRGDLLQGTEAVYDFAVANILADVIIMLSEPLRAALKEGGIFVCSGIIRERAEDVKKALEEQRYEIIDTRLRGEWVAFAARRL